MLHYLTNFEVLITFVPEIHLSAKIRILFSDEKDFTSKFWTHTPGFHKFKTKTGFRATI